MLHESDGSISALQPGAYLEKQFRQSLKKAYNPKRTYQAQSVIISFSPEEFDTKDLDKQASQALKLVQSYVHHYFGDAQSVIAIQSDGSGGKLHAHLLINTVKRNGMTIQTNRFTVNKMRHDFNNHLQQNFHKVTGRTWQDPFKQPSPRQDIHNLSSKFSWQAELKQTIDKIKQEVSNVTDFLARLKSRGITVKARGKKQRWTYSQTVLGKQGKPKELKVRAFYQRKDKAGRVVATRGLGQDYTKEGLEKYWQRQAAKQKEQAVEPAHSYKKGVNNGQLQQQTDVQIRQSEEIEKIKTMARDSQLAANRRRQRVSQNLRELRASEAQEHQRRIKQQAEHAIKGRGDQSRPNRVSQQQRFAEATRRRVRAELSRKRRNKEKSAGPDL